ncbi:YceD family protein [Terrarubrum flagellatum]|uniref:YceD family protein n=1 Tax=Terrirubrum flagellatum TaxID=2895980 RepID=UPI00314505E3
MTQKAEKSPLSYPVIVTDVPPKGLDVVIEADERERAEVAADFELPAIHSLVGRFHIGHTSLGLRVTGTVKAKITQICTISIEPFEDDVEEEVEVDFAEPSRLPPVPTDGPAADDPPDPIVDGAIDLGALTAEFLALGVDPYPRKPGVDFDYDDAAGRAATSPFASLVKLKPDDKK